MSPNTTQGFIPCFSVCICVQLLAGFHRKTAFIIEGPSWEQFYVYDAATNAQVVYISTTGTLCAAGPGYFNTFTGSTAHVIWYVNMYGSISTEPAGCGWQFLLDRMPM